MRSSDSVCVPGQLERGEQPIGSIDASVLLSSQSAFRPYRLWTFARYMEATSASRRLFWERASDEKRAEIAAELSRLQERSELLQEARLDFGAEKWGLKSSGGSSSSAIASAVAGSGELPDEEEDVI